MTLTRVVPEAGVEGDTADRRPCLREDAVLRVCLLDVRLSEVGVQLDLVHRRHHRDVRQQPVEMASHEVADPDGADLAVGQQCLQRLVGGEGLVEAVGCGLVQDQQVQLLDTELADGLVEGMQGLVVSVVAHPDLGLDEHLGAVDARAADAFADFALIAVGRSGVDMPVADLERGLDRGRGLGGRALEDTESEGGQDDPVVQGHGRSCGGLSHGYSF